MFDEIVAFLFELFVFGVVEVVFVELEFDFGELRVEVREADAEHEAAPTEHEAEAAPEKVANQAGPASPAAADPLGA